MVLTLVNLDKFIVVGDRVLVKPQEENALFKRRIRK